MDRFERLGLDRYSARQAVAAVAICTLILAVLAGDSIRRAGEEMRPGVARSLVLAVGEPLGWLSDRLPFTDATDDATAWLSPDEDLGGASGFGPAVTEAGGGVKGGIPPVTPEAFDPAVLGLDTKPLELRTLLVTGDSLSTPLDVELARQLADGDVEVVRDPHVGTGISNSTIVDWAKLSERQVEREKPDAIVVFIGANDGFPFPQSGGGEIECCGVPWATVYANRVRQLMNTYRQAGDARVYWVTVPTPRDPKRQEIARTVNAAIEVARDPWRSQVRLIDTVPIFTPDGQYRASMPVDGRDTIVRESDGIHLNEAGSELLAETVLDAVERDFEW
jgi:lysophospholipase L1-like esterase